MNKIAYFLISVFIVLISFSAKLRADTANVNVFGMANMAFESVQAGGGSVPANTFNNRFRAANNASSFGIKGTEDLGGGLKALYQWDISASMSSTSAIGGTRNTGVGLSSESCGTFMLGFWDTPFKTIHTPTEVFFSVGTSNQSAMVATTGMNGVSSNQVIVGTTNGQRLSFGRRSGSSVQWWSPKYMGISGRLMWGTNVEKTATINNPSLLSASLTYEMGDLTVSYGFERHDDFFAGVTSGGPPGFTVAAKTPINTSKDMGHRLVAVYKIGEMTKIGGDFTRLKYTSTQAAGENSYSKSGFALSVIQSLMDKLTFRASYGVSSDGTQTNGTDMTGFGASLLVAGFGYNFSKRTDVYTYFSKLNNKFKAQYNYHVNPIGYSNNMDPGQDPQTFALGLRHTF